MNGLSETRALLDIRRNIMLYCPSVMSDARDGLVADEIRFQNRALRPLAIDCCCFWYQLRGYGDAVYYNFVRVLQYNI